MARYRKPEGPDPRLKLNLREAREGGSLRSRVEQIPAQATRPVMVVLVHGFNNHAGEAGTAYWNFRQNQVEACWPRDPQLEDFLADAFWPGDAAWGRFDLADFLVYPAAVGTARKAGPALAQHLASMPNALQVHFIGHSLGCRVVLETIEELLRLGHGSLIGKVLLMAAAVPVFKLLPGSRGDLRRAILHPRGDELLILYSKDDVVLRYTFGPGQTAARGDEGFLPTALGHERPPPQVRPEAAAAWGAGHGDYWPGGTRKNSETQRGIARQVAKFFGWSNQRVLDRRMLPAAMTPDVRELPAARVIA